MKWYSCAMEPRKPSNTEQLSGGEGTRRALSWSSVTGNDQSCESVDAPPNLSAGEGRGGMEGRGEPSQGLMMGEGHGMRMRRLVRGVACAVEEVGGAESSISVATVPRTALCRNTCDSVRSEGVRGGE